MNPLETAVTIAREAGALILAYRERELHIAEKTRPGDLVTDADRASEALIVERLRAAYPAAALLGEEGASQSGTSGERWIFDPIDGTTNYAHGYPLYCVAIAYEVEGVLQAGVIYAPALGELYAAERGKGATLNGRKVHVSTAADVASSLVCTGFVPGQFRRNAGSWARLSERAQAVRRDGSAALDLAFVASGRFEAFWEYDLKAWDIAAGALIVEEAGGTVSAIDGSPHRTDGGSTLATNGRIHAEMVEHLSDAERDGHA